MKMEEVALMMAKDHLDNVGVIVTLQATGERRWFPYEDWDGTREQFDDAFHSGELRDCLAFHWEKLEPAP